MPRCLVECQGKQTIFDYTVPTLDTREEERLRQKNAAVRQYCGENCGAGNCAAIKIGKANVTAVINTLLGGLEEAKTFRKQ